MGLDRGQFATWFFMPLLFGILIILAIPNEYIEYKIAIVCVLAVSNLVLFHLRIKNLRHSPYIIIFYFIPFLNLAFLGYLLFTHSPIDKTQDLNFCTSCGKEKVKDHKYCPYCGKQYQSSSINNNKNYRPFWEPLNPLLKVSFIFLGLLGLRAWFSIGDALKYPILYYSTNFNSPITSENGISDFHQTATAKAILRWLETQEANDLNTRTTPTIFAEDSTIIPFDTTLTPTCIRWDDVSQIHVGEKYCVYGRVIKIMHNNYGNGSIEYVVRFDSTNDHFLVKSENYWLPDLEEGDCWEFKGIIQESPSYYFMKVITGSDVLAEPSNLCN